MVISLRFPNIRKLNTPWLQIDFDNRLLYRFHDGCIHNLVNPVLSESDHLAFRLRITFGGIDTFKYTHLDETRIAFSNCTRFQARRFNRQIDDIESMTEPEAENET